MSFTPELGQAAFSNSQWQARDLDGLLEDGLCVIAQAVQAGRNDDDSEGSLVSNSGADPYESPIFAMRSYCWCDGDRDGHDAGCPPNFEHYGSGLTVSWYKHVGRGGSQNMPVAPLAWFDILRECLDDVLQR